MFSGADFFDLLADEFPGLGRRGFPFARITARTFDSLVLRHN
jgi:hypothetical protein